MRAVVAVALVSFGCHDLTPKQQHAANVFECRARALEPYVGDVIDVGDAVRQIALGRADPVKILGVLGVARSDIQQAVQSWNACDPEVIRAPPPERGNRLL